MNGVRLAAPWMLVLLSAGCATYQAYDGPQRPASELAIVSGASKFRAATPLALIIRAVDERPVDVRYNSVALTPGRHELIIDCQLGSEPGTASRHVLDVDVAAGDRYGLSAQMSPGNRACESVALESR
jgi:hypothetical protein